MALAHRAGALLRLLVPPLVAFAAAQLAVLLGAVLAGAAPFDDATWARWDSNLYLNIASQGYGAAPCGPDYGGPSQLCGNAGWFPLYPLIVGLGYHVFGLPLGAFAVVVSLACCLATLVALWILVLRARPTPANLLALTFAAFCPGMVYTHAVFPMSLATLLLVLAFAALQRERFGLAGVAAFGAAAAYPTALLLAPAAGLWLLLRHRRRPALLVAGGAALGFAAANLAIWIQTGRADAYFQTQAKYEHGLHWPTALFGDAVAPLFDGARGPQLIVAAHEIATAATVLAVVVGALIWARREPLTGVLVLYGLLQFVVPLTQHGVSWYRGDSLLLPLAVLVARLPVALGLPVAGIGMLLAVPMAQAFVQGILV